jgi:Lrp/AsnC family leucine-responsive transcriptional regulator
MDLLQQDARVTNQALADKVALSPSACLRRVRDLEERGFITGYRAQIAVDKIRNVLIVMAQISFERHTLNDFGAFDACLDNMPEVVESCRVSGLYDYMLRAVVSDIQEWKSLMLVMLNGGYGVEKIVSHFLMDEMKSFKGYQLIMTNDTEGRKPPRQP